MVQLLTIGYSGRNARDFFTTLREAGVTKVIDVRLYNTSQLAGFTKKGDLQYFLGAIGGIDYAHMPVMAPTKQLLNDYKAGLVDWPQYESQFRAIITERRIQDRVTIEEMHLNCLLCTEATPQMCHRRLVAEYLVAGNSNISIRHL